jgi:hypothetical protein
MNNKIWVRVSFALLVIALGAGVLIGRQQMNRRDLERRIHVADSSVTALKARSERTEHVRDSLGALVASQTGVVAAASARADAAELRAKHVAFRVDTAKRFLLGPKDSGQVDTTTYGSVVRSVDNRAFAVPMFTLQRIATLEELRTTLLDLNGALRTQLQRQATLLHADTVHIVVLDSTIAAQDTAIVLRDQRHSRLGFKSGAIAGATAVLAVTRPELFVKAGGWLLHLLKR